ncbi:hypothetical protein F5141DRAFT_1188004 [Pisolithus sp. B1]|nr:hypothetical protein F5141DRAFT_1188004 [Pisolithus sp. B1]
MCTPPNISAWSESLEAYLGGMGYKVDTKYCPLCFGGHNWQNNNSSNIDAIVCIDACFTQKRRSGLQDDPVNPTATIFLSQEEIDSMECEVDSLRKKKPSFADERRGGYASKRKHRDEEDGFEQGMKIPISVLNTCNESFTAADEKHQKASTQFFSDTGVMALLCHHDHVIHLANMTSAGEKQHYALALIKSLFSHLPDNFHIGLLYDIGCQLEQSCRKWGFLKPFLPQISFAISVFHAFGHQWPCQLIYHPQKQEGFGLSDGEGCECFWSSIKALIPLLCVSGFHQCLFVIDFQVHHLDAKSLTGLGQWLLRQWNHCQAKKASAIRGLRKCGVGILTLQAEWVTQVAVQTKATPHKLITDNHCHSAKATENIILQIMATQKSLENYETRLEELEKHLLHVASDMMSLNIQLAECQQRIRCFKQALQKQKATLGVNGLADLATLQSNSYLQVNHLHQRKFELERLECSYRQTVSEQRLQNHTETFVKQCEPGLMAALIQQGKAPVGSIAPVLIPRDALFKLDVDDDIWQDAGLEDDPGRFPPAWLADEKLRHCEEEEKTLMEWFSEEWSHLQRAREGSGETVVNRKFHD